MNNLHDPCEPWAEPISLAAAGCLSPEEERDVRRHVETCSGCRGRLEDLTQLCGTLAAAQTPAGNEGAAAVDRVLSAIAAEKPRCRRDGGRGEMIHPTLFTRSLNAWRWIMRSRVSRATMAAVLLVVGTGVVLWFHGGGATPAFADFLAPILEAKSAKFKVTTEIQGSPIKTLTSEFLVLDATRTRQETAIAGLGGSTTEKAGQSVTITDWGLAKGLVLDPAAKKAVVLTLENLTPEQIAQQDTFAHFRSILLDARDKPEVNREPLGEKEIDGRRVVGFRVRAKGTEMSLWGDPKTGLPVRVESTMAMYPGVKATMSDFVFDVDMDKSLFSVDPPAGYEVQNMKVDVSPPREKDLIEMFREYSTLTGGDFPETLDGRTIGQELGKKVAMQTAAENVAPGKEKPTRSQMQEQVWKVVEATTQKMTQVQLRVQRGLMFALVLPPEADAHYAGKSVKFGSGDKPIFWYRPRDAKNYRVIYADLSVRETAASPNIVGAQPVAAPSDAAK